MKAFLLGVAATFVNIYWYSFLLGNLPWTTFETSRKLARQLQFYVLEVFIIFAVVVWYVYEFFLKTPGEKYNEHFK